MQGLALSMQKDMQAIMDDKGGISEDIIYYPHDVENKEYSLRGFFSNAPLDVITGGMKSPLLGNSPVLTLENAALESLLGRKLHQKDEVSVRGVRYACQTPRYNSYNMVTVKLMESKLALGSNNGCL